MRIHRYWARETRRETDPQGKQLTLTCWRGSGSSVNDARLAAQECVAEIARRVRRGQPLARYAYGTRPLREEIVEELGDGRQPASAIITRNAYGALVLNTAHVMFIDIDFPRQGCAPSLLAWLTRSGQDAQQEAALERVRSWMLDVEAWSMRVYRTFAGLRLLITHDLFDPTADGTLNVLQELQSDPLYIRLCRHQESFRARLSPKPWRMRLEKPPSRYPWESSEQEYSYRQWVARYDGVAAEFAVCQLVAELGNGREHPEVGSLIALHDRYTCTGDDLRLA